MFAQFLRKKEFTTKYMQLYAMRQAIANLEMEDHKEDMLSPIHTQELFSNVIAFENILNQKPEKISPYDLTDIADDINNGMFMKGFRKTQVDVRSAKNFFPPSPREVPQAVYSLFDSYHNIWTDLPVYVKEAKLHIELVRIQPFEDGNKRSTRILTNYNLCHQNRAPVIIPGSETDRYFSYIDNYDVNAMADLLKQKSHEEFEIMLELYQNLCGDDLDDPYANMTSEGRKEYVKTKTLVDDIMSVKEYKRT